MPCRSKALRVPVLNEPADLRGGWLRSWAAGYLLVIPAILQVDSWLPAQVDRLID